MTTGRINQVTAFPETGPCAVNENHTQPGSVPAARGRGMFRKAF